MTHDKDRPAVPAIETIEELLAHGKVLEEEAAAGYAEMGDAMEVHNNLEVAGLFRQLQTYSLKHAAEIEERSRGLRIPRIAPWNLKWRNGTAPEAASMTDAHYLMNPYQALRLAHRAEMGAHDFYASVAAATGNAEVKGMAAEFAEEEAGHVVMLEEWMARFPKPEDGWDEDPDPPGMPE
ncbi:MAG: rubrerythrin [Magnetospirillum sp. WYHS-4]